MNFDERKFEHGLALIRQTMRNSSVRITGVNRESGMVALKYVSEIALLCADMHRNSGPAPRQNEREAGHPSIAHEANPLAPAPSHTDSEGGANLPTPERASSPPPLPSLPETHSAAGHVDGADEATRFPPARAVVPVPRTDAMRKAAIDARERTTTALAKTFTLIDGRDLTDLRLAEVERLALGRGQEAAKRGLESAVLLAVWPHVAAHVRRGEGNARVGEVLSGKALAGIVADVKREGKKVARVVLSAVNELTAT
jgi:hypothetical protein